MPCAEEQLHMLLGISSFLGNNRGMLMLLLIVDAGTYGECFDKRVVGNGLVKIVELEGLVLYFRNLYNVCSVVQ